MRKAVLMLLAVLFTATACTASRSENSDTLTVEGWVTARGHEPFVELVLRTDDRNEYVLSLEELPAASRDSLRERNPGRYRVTGELYKDDWNGRPYAHLRVTSWERVEPNGEDQENEGASG